MTSTVTSLPCGGGANSAQARGAAAHATIAATAAERENLLVTLILRRSKSKGFENGERNPSLKVMAFRAACILCFLALASVPAQPADPPVAPDESAVFGAVQVPPKVVPRVLDLATPENTKITVSLGRQRASLLVAGEVAIETPVSSGQRRARTPAGNFQITEKATTHLSGQHGDFVDSKGRAVRTGVSTRTDPAPSGTAFRPVALQYYMKLNADGLALHAGRLPGYPSSDVTVRLPADIAPLIYQRVKVGTPVTIED